MNSGMGCEALQYATIKCPHEMGSDQISSRMRYIYGLVVGKAVIAVRETVHGDANFGCDEIFCKSLSLSRK